jgi:hypothetical protein
MSTVAYHSNPIVIAAHTTHSACETCFDWVMNLTQAEHEAKCQHLPYALHTWGDDAPATNTPCELCNNTPATPDRVLIHTSITTANVLQLTADLLQLHSDAPAENRPRLIEFLTNTALEADACNDTDVAAICRTALTTLLTHPRP